MHRHNIGASNQGEFQVITKVPFKDLLRNYFGTQDLELELMTFVTNKDYMVKDPSNQMQFEYPSARVLDDAFSVEVPADKGKKTLIWIAPRPGADKGKLSDSILDLIVLSCCPDGLKQHLAPEKSKYYLVASWTTSLKTGRYCEPVWTDENIPEMKEYTNKLVKMPLRYSDGLLKDTKIDFYIPPVLIQNRFGTNPIEMGHGRRLEQDLLVSKGYITSNGEPTSLAREIVSQLQNFIFLEWWRGYFVIKRDLREPIENLIEKYPQVSEIIRLKAYLDVETARHPLNFEITIDDMSVELKIEKERIPKYLQQFIIGDNPGSYCLSETTFFFPPRVTKKITRDWRKIKKELKSTFACVGRKAKINEILSFVNSDRNILLIHGPEGAGKTRILVECAQLSEEIWNWYWVSPDTTIKWDVLFTELARESRKTILVFDNLMFYKDWNAFLLNAFEGLDYSKLQLKIVFVVWEPWIASFIQQKYLLHGSSSFQEIEILPLTLTPEIREALKEQLTTQGIPIEFVDIIINNSDGYPDKMQEIIEGLKFFPTGRGGSEVSQFDQRMTLLWNDPPAINIPSEFSSFLLDQKERDFLFFLSLVKTWRVNVDNRSIFTGVDRYDISIVESLIKKDWVIFSDGTIRWKRDAKRKWVFEYNTLKSGKKRTSFESYLRVYVKEDPSIYATIIETLGDRITYKDTIMILEQIDGWGELSTLNRFKQEIEALQKLCILFCRKYFENLYVMENDPTSAKKYTDSSLYDDVPFKFKQLVKKEVGVVREMLSRERFKDISHHCFLLIHIMNAAGEFLQSEQLLDIITSLRDPVDEPFFLLKTELLIYYRHDWENSKNYVEILSKENKLSLIGKAQVKFFLAHEHVMVQGEFTKSDVDLILESSSLYEELNAREKFIALWSRVLSTFLNCKIKNLRCNSFCSLKICEFIA